MPMFPATVRVPPTLNAPETEAAPMTSKATSGDEVLIPTRLLVVSTLKTLVSTSKSEDRESTAKVEAPETVNVSDTRCAGFKVMGPMPLVLVSGRVYMVGTCLEKDSKLDVRALTLCSRVSRSMRTVFRSKEEAEASLTILAMICGWEGGTIVCPVCW